MKQEEKITLLSVLSDFHMVPVNVVPIGTDPNDEVEVKKLIRSWIVPSLYAYERQKPLLFSELKAALEEVLNSESIQVSDIFYNDDNLFEMPDVPKNYYCWVWEVLFEEGYSWSE